MSLLLALLGTPPVVQTGRPVIIATKGDVQIAEQLFVSRFFPTPFGAAPVVNIRLPRIVRNLVGEIQDEYVRSFWLAPGYRPKTERLPRLQYAQQWVDERVRYDEVQSQFLRSGSFVAASPYWVLYGTAPDAFVYEDIGLNYRSWFITYLNNAPPAPAGSIWKPLMARGGRGRLGR